MQETSPKPSRRKVEPIGTFTLLRRYVTSRSLGMTLLKIFGAFLGTLLLVHFGLYWFTNHGQRLEVRNYVDMTIEEAEDAIWDDDFEMELLDSIYLVDKEPGMVLSQDPPPGAFVKENRRIYLTVTKSVADMVTLPSLTGTYELDRYQRKLALIDLVGTVADREYSSKYQPNTILKVYHEGREISEQELRNGYRVARGSKLQFLVSTKDGGEARLPNLRCRTYDEARFLLTNYRLTTGEVEEDSTVVHPPSAYVYRQDPPFEPGAALPFDAEVKLFLTQRQPRGCDGI